MDIINYGEGSTKVFVESATSRIINGIFYLNLRSGNEDHGYVIPLPLAKVLGKAITKQVEEVEKQTGQKFEGGSSSESVPSPWSSPTEKNR